MTRHFNYHLSARTFVEVACMVDNGFSPVITRQNCLMHLGDSLCQMQEIARN